VWKASTFFFAQVDRGIDFQSKTATTSLHKSHLRTFLLQSSAEENESSFQIVLDFW
jgi:hypothetical protein